MTNQVRLAYFPSQHRRVFWLMGFVKSNTEIQQPNWGGTADHAFVPIWDERVFV